MQVVDVDSALFLAYAITSAYPLLEHHGIPVEIIIHDNVGKLKVEPF